MNTKMAFGSTHVQYLLLTEAHVFLFNNSSAFILHQEFLSLLIINSNITPNNISTKDIRMQQELSFATQMDSYSFAQTMCELEYSSFFVIHFTDQT
jgi:hypothetical protein